MLNQSTPDTITQVRDEARVLLNEFDAADGLACFYTLHYDPNRTTVITHHDAGGILDGCATRCQTGFRLFDPMVILRVRGSGEVLPALLREACAPRRPYLFFAPVALAEALGKYLSLSEISHNLILRLDPAQFKPKINALVIHKTDKTGNPRAEVQREGRLLAAAGVNWCSPVFAEIFVQVEEDQRGQGLGQTVVAAVTSELLRKKIMPLYIVEESNAASRQIASRLGFVDTGAREFTARGVLLQA
jgi:RimJ/RimL family protein N-acetyltransferase